MPAFAAPFGIYWPRTNSSRTRRIALRLRGVAQARKDGKPSTVNDSSDEDTGYTAELRLPWYGLGAPAAAQAKKPASPGRWRTRDHHLAVFQNGDLKDRYHTSSRRDFEEAFFHVQADQFPRYTITAE